MFSTLQLIQTNCHNSADKVKLSAAMYDSVQIPWPETLEVAPTDAPKTPAKSDAVCFSSWKVVRY